MNIFLYTVSDFSANALRCIDLLNNSLNYQNNVKLNILCNNIPPPECQFNCIFDETYKEIFPGFLKYSDKIPEGYDYYLYLDSDILFFDNITNILPKKNNLYSLVFEEKIAKNNPWFNYSGFIENENIKGINSGSFVIKDRKHLQEMKNFCDTNLSANSMVNAQIDQSALNFLVSKKNYSNYEDFSEKVQLFCDADTNIEKGKTIFHFCGFEGHMSNKLNKMGKFYDNNAR